jgi:hypothetical protein
MKAKKELQFPMPMETALRLALPQVDNVDRWIELRSWIDYVNRSSKKTRSAWPGGPYNLSFAEEKNKPFMDQSSFSGWRTIFLNWRKWKISAMRRRVGKIGAKKSVETRNGKKKSLARKPRGWITDLLHSGVRFAWTGRRFCFSSITDLLHSALFPASEGKKTDVVRNGEQMKTLPCEPQIQSLESFIRAMDRDMITAWRWRKKGWLETVNIAGRQYVTAEGIAKFKRRAEAGEFSQKHKTPSLQAA